MHRAPGQVIRDKERGLIKEGYYADLVIFDKDTIKGVQTRRTVRKPEGIRLPQRTKVVEDNEYLGEALRKSSAKIRIACTNGYVRNIFLS